MSVPPSPTANKNRSISVDDRLRDATQHFIADRCVECARLCAQIYAEAFATGDFELCSFAALLAAKAHFNQYIFSDCVTWAQRAEETARKIGHTENLALATVVLAGALAGMDDYEEGIKLAFQALKLLPDDASVETKLNVFTGVGITYASLGLSRHALDIFRRAHLTADRSQVSAAKKCRFLQNYIEGLLDYHAFVAPVNEFGAERIQAEAMLLCDRLKRDARAENLNYFSRSARRLALCWGMFSPNHQAVADELSGFFTEGLDNNKSDELNALLLLAHDAYQREEHENARNYAARAEKLQRKQLARGGHSRLLRNEMKFALYSGDEKRALTLREKYYCYVLRNEHAAYEARMEELNAAISAQAMQVQIVELQSQNVGLTKHFDALSELALTDTLTQLLNRRGIEQRFSQLCTSNSGFCVAMIDIDNFKKVNDQFSHVVGDQALREVARLMKHSVRDHDFLGRFGGEEFLAFIHTSDLNEAHQIAERLRENVQSFAWSSVCDQLSITVCVGVCKHLPNERMIDVVRRVDSLLYAAKNSGRNTVISKE